MNALASSSTPIPDRGVVELGDLTVDLEMRTLHRAGETIAVGSRAFDILAVLVLAEGRLVTKDELMSAVWPNTIVEENNIQVHLSSLRKVLGAGRNLIVTVPGRGYRLVRPEVKLVPARCVDHLAAAPVLNTRVFAASVVGREGDLERLLDLLHDTRLLTVTGPGGVGKSSLAHEVLRRVAAQERQTWQVDLASATSGEAVLDACLDALGAQSGSHEAPSQGPATIEQLEHVFQQAAGLLLIDNAEHFIADVAEIAHRVIVANRQLQVLVTSREPLHITSETIFRLAPLECPAADATAAGIAAAPAARLFRERANALCPGLANDPEQFATIGDICRRLDGNPLAIELAAARLPSLGLQDLRQRLADPLTILVGGYRTAPARHRSFRATFDWSYSLLDADQAAVFRRISVFSTPFSFEALCSVTCDRHLSVDNVINCASDLVAKSLLSVQFTGPVARYRMTEAARHYGLEQLAASGEFHNTRAHHAHFVADQLSYLSTSHDPAVALPDDLCEETRRALDWAFSAQGDIRTGIDLSAVLVDVCLKYGKIDECCRYASRAIDVMTMYPDDVADDISRMRVMAAFAAVLPHSGGNMDKVDDIWRDVLERAIEAEHHDLHLRALYGLWDTRISQGRIVESESIALRFRLRVRAKGSEWQIILGDLLFAISLHCLARHEEAKAGLTDATERLTRLKQEIFPSRRIPVDPLVFCSGTLARIAWLQGNANEAMGSIETLVDQVLPETLEPTLSHVLGTVAAPLALMTGDLDNASRYISLMHRHSNDSRLTHWLDYAEGLRGCHDVLAGNIESGLSALESVIEKMLARGYRRVLTPLIVMWAEGLAQVGRAEEALEQLQTLLAFCEKNGDMLYLPEVWRAMAAVVFTGGRSGARDVDTDSALAYVDKAIELAEAQGAPALSARAAVTRETIVGGIGPASHLPLVPQA
ncbi:putative ATPase/DNA-binding winged helix-turn-helix (wHTH) protein [Paraburkholderia sp. GAS199]|uniref:ATP-binding protein n=1 Tax=Paraburkholderia sp. GAS199 TaxID=3035126 RepID=UPI003D1F25C3